MIHLHKGDLPDNLVFHGAIAVDTETTGLSLTRDKLCLVQISVGDGEAHLVQFDHHNYACPNLKNILASPHVEKIFHYGRFDLAMIAKHLGVWAEPIFCTKIASQLVRTYTDRHGLKELVREFLGFDLSKQQQSSDWAIGELTEEQLQYAASDVLYLHTIKDRLTAMLERENRLPLARACFSFLPTRAALDLAGWNNKDIFAHSVV